MSPSVTPLVSPNSMWGIHRSESTRQWSDGGDTKGVRGYIS